MSDESQTSAPNPTRAAVGSFDAFVDPHPAVVLRVPGSLCRNPQDAEDLVQDRRLKLVLADTSAPMPAEPLQRLQALATELASGDTPSS